MTLKLHPRQKAALLVIITVFFLATLINPFFNSLYSYIKYKDVASHKLYANADVRSIEYKNPFLGVFGYCYMVVKYDFAYSQKLYHSQDNLNCNYKNKVTIANTLPLYFDQNHPQDSVSEYALASSESQLVKNSLLGITGTIFIVALWIIFRTNQKRKSKSSNQVIIM